MASYLLHVNGACYVALGIRFVRRGALQGLGYTFVPTLTGIIERMMRVGAAFGFSGVVWGNPLAWVRAVVVLVPAYRRRSDASRPCRTREPARLPSLSFSRVRSRGRSSSTP
jgi:Na+-driven multidrug efflux pump